MICRKIAKDSRYSTYMQVKRVIDEWKLSSLFSFHETNMVITCEANGMQIIFKGLDDLEKIKSIVPAKGALTDIWIEEATQADYRDAKDLLKRQRGGDEKVKKRLTLSFNPILQLHWIYKTYFSRIGWTDNQKEFRSPELTILKTTYKDNRFLTLGDVEDLEQEEDKYYYDVYTLGMWGVLGHVIFTNWETRDLSDMRDRFTNLRNGLDFGYANDPLATTRSHYDRAHKTIYIFDELHKLGWTNDVVSNTLLGIIGREVIVCDSADPKSIRELQQDGITAIPAQKGPGSVLFGIQWLQQQHIVIDSSCIHTIDEFQQYHWREDKSGNVLPEPVGRNDHHIDSLRYAYEFDMLEPEPEDVQEFIVHDEDVRISAI